MNAHVPSPVRAKASPSPSHMPLFRPEALAEGGPRALGTVLLEPKIANWVFAAVGLGATVCVLALLIFGSYTRKAQLHGWLVPHQGLVRVLAPHAGVVTRIDVREGMPVSKGSPLLTLSTESRSEAGATQEEIVTRLKRRRDSMAAQKSVQDRLFAEQQGNLESRIAALRAERAHLKEELALQRKRLALDDKVLNKERLLRARDLITAPRLQQTEQARLDQAAKVEAAERSESTLLREQLQVEGTLQELPFKRQTMLAEIERQVAALEQDLAQAEAQRQIVLTAPQDGTITAIQADVGSSAGPNVPVMSIVPKGSVLEAHLFSPSRAVGFIHAGQRVLLRYQAFPYQKFGFYAGTVAHVSRATVSPSELAPQLNGLTSLVATGEPVYRITVALDRQTANAYGKPVALQPGMQLEADVLIENRRLIEWVLDPLFTLTGTWKR